MYNNESLEQSAGLLRFLRLLHSICLKVNKLLHANLSFSKFTKNHPLFSNKFVNSCILEIYHKYNPLAINAHWRYTILPSRRGEVEHTIEQLNEFELAVDKGLAWLTNQESILRHIVVVQDEDSLDLLKV